MEIFVHIRYNFLEMRRKGKLEAEKRVVKTMIMMYCRKKHHQNKPCASCSALIDYACQRIESCPEKERKPFCSRCRIHCYHSEMRERIRLVMRYSGPRMLFRHPIMTIAHMLGIH